MYLIKIAMLAMAVFCLTAFAQAEVNINTATVQQLTELNNIGIVKANAIVDYRTKHGRFSRVDDLSKVMGIGAAIIKENREKLTVGTTSEPTSAKEGTALIEKSFTMEREN